MFYLFLMSWSDKQHVRWTVLICQGSSAFKNEAFYQVVFAIFMLLVKVKFGMDQIPQDAKNNEDDPNKGSPPPKNFAETVN